MDLALFFFYVQLAICHSVQRYWASGSIQIVCTTVTLASVCSSCPAGHTSGELDKRCLVHTERQWHRLCRRTSAANREVKQGSRGTGQRQVSDPRNCKDPVAGRHSSCYGCTSDGIWSSCTHLNHKGYVLLSKAALIPHTGTPAEVTMLYRPQSCPVWLLKTRAALRNAFSLC